MAWLPAESYPCGVDTSCDRRHFDSAWGAFGDITFRAEADKKFKYPLLSDFTTLQQLADAAVDSVLIDRDYNFSNNETVNFGGKTLTIDCKAKFIGDGNLVFTQLGKGSIVIAPLWRVLQRRG